MFNMSSRLVALAISAAIASTPIAVSQAHEVWVTNMTSANVTVYSTDNYKLIAKIGRASCRERV